ncbi:MAG: NAD-dependent epimerase/dehydratase family protein [bacterium]
MAELDSPLALVTGGNGFVGSHLCEELSSQGFRLRLLLRRTSKTANLQGPSYETVYGDLQDEPSLKAAVAGVDYVFHSAGQVRAFNREEFHRVNGEGTRNLVAAAAERGDQIKRFVYVSSQAAAGPGQPDRPRLETDQPAPISDYGQSKLSGELAVLKYAEQVPITIVRPSAVFGPRDTDVFQFFQLAVAGWKVKFGGRETFVSVAFVKDVVAGIIAAAKNERAIGETFFLNSEDVISTWKSQEMIADALKVETKPLRVPVLLLKVLAQLDTANARKSGRAPNLTPDKVGELTCPNWTCSSQKMRDVLGVTPQLPLQAAFNETATWYRERGWL